MDVTNDTLRVAFGDEAIKVVLGDDYQESFRNLLEGKYNNSKALRRQVPADNNIIKALILRQIAGGSTREQAIEYVFQTFLDLFANDPEWVDDARMTPYLVVEAQFHNKVDQFLLKQNASVRRALETVLVRLNSFGMQEEKFGYFLDDLQEAYSNPKDKELVNDLIDFSREVFRAEVLDGVVLTKALMLTMGSEEELLELYFCNDEEE